MVVCRICNVIRSVCCNFNEHHQRSMKESFLVALKLNRFLFVIFKAMGLYFGDNIVIVSGVYMVLPALAFDCPTHHNSHWGMFCDVGNKYIFEFWGNVFTNFKTLCVIILPSQIERFAKVHSFRDTKLCSFWVPLVSCHLKPLFSKLLN